ncbi:unnamed protein product [Ixodes persulcatus]
MCKFALFRFDDGTLAVGITSIIKNYDPRVHNSSAWPQYESADQKVNLVTVNWPDRDKKTGRATGTTTLYPAQVVEFGKTRSELEQRCDSFIEETNRAILLRSSEKEQTTKKRKAKPVEDRVLACLRQDIQEKRASNILSENLPHSAPAHIVTETAPSTEHITVKCLKRQLAITERAKETAEQRASAAEERAKERANAAEEREKAANERLFSLQDALLPKMNVVLDAFQSQTLRQECVVPQAVSNASLFGHIVVPAARLARLNDKTASAYTQELAVMVFGKETLATCCLTGTASGKEALPKASVEDIVDHVVQKFPGETTGTVRAYLRRKCNNMDYTSKKQKYKN